MFKEFSSLSDKINEWMKWIEKTVCRFISRKITAICSIAHWIYWFLIKKCSIKAYLTYILRQMWLCFNPTLDCCNIFEMLIFRIISYNHFWNCDLFFTSIKLIKHKIQILFIEIHTVIGFTFLFVFSFNSDKKTTSIKFLYVLGFFSSKRINFYKQFICYKIRENRALATTNQTRMRCYIKNAQLI